MTFPPVCPIADVQEWLPQQNIGGPMTESRGLVLHVNAGNGDPYGWWTQPTTPTASSHFQLMKSGQLIQYVRLDTVAWCQVAGSTMWHSIETEGFPNEPLTDAAVAKLAALYAWGHVNCGWPLQLADTPDGTGFGWHGMGGDAWGGHYGCPGDARKAQRTQILQLAQTSEDDLTPQQDLLLHTIGGAVMQLAGAITKLQVDQGRLGAILEYGDVDGDGKVDHLGLVQLRDLCNAILAAVKAQPAGTGGDVATLMEQLKTLSFTVKATA